MVDDAGKKDYVPDDSALVIDMEEGLVIIAGCSHSGICNIVDYARHVSGRRKVLAVIGGFHLSRNDARVRKTVEFFKEAGVKHVIPSHCTQLPALSTFYRHFPFKQLCSGSLIRLPVL